MPATTDFPRPDQALLDDLVADALASAGERSTERRWIETGSSSIVLLAGDTAVRIARDRHGAAELTRSQRVVDALDLPFAVPASRGEPVSLDGHLAVPTARLRGEVPAPGPAEPQALAAVVEAIRSHDRTHVGPHLAPRRAFAGPSWYATATELAVPLLPPDVQDAARQAVDELRALEETPAHDRVLSHCDLAGANLLWSGGHIAGVLDWDLATLDDSAADLACLAAWHGWDTVAQIATPSELARARTIHHSFRLQQVCFALVRDRPATEVDRVVASAAAWYRRGD